MVQKFPSPILVATRSSCFFEDDEELLYFAGTIRAFFALTELDRLAATPHVFAYFKDFTDEHGFEWGDSDMKRLTGPTEDIWRFVYPTVLGAQEGWDIANRDRMRQYVVLEANCGWEREHGILMSWRDGKDLVKVSGYDGHATNAHAYGDLTKDAWIYHSLNPGKGTRNPLVAAPNGPQTSKPLWKFW